MRLAIKLIGGLIVLLVVIAAVALFGAQTYISNGDHRDLVQTKASEALGRQVTIGEITGASLFPPAVGVRELTVANAEGMTDPHFVSVAEADIGLKLMPLLSRRIEISRFTLNAPEIYLEKRADGEVNWVLGADDSAPVTDDESDSDSDSGNEAGGSGLDDIVLGTVAINDGKITYRDQASDQVFVAEDADLNITLTSLDDPLEADGTMLFQGKPATVDTTVSTPRSLMENTASEIALEFTVEDNSVDTTINLAGGELAYNGYLDVDAPSLKSLLATLGMPLEVESGFNRLNIAGDVSGNASSMNFRNAQIRFDEISNTADGTTNVSFDWGGARPKVSGEIDLERLDLRPYLPAPPEQVQANVEDKGAPFPPWPTDRIDFSPLQAVDVDLAATTKGINLHGMEFGSSGLDFNITNGLLVAQLTELSLYGGGGGGTLRVNTRERTPSVALQNVALSGLNAQTFAREVLGLNRLQGVGGLQADLTARGYSVADFMSSLNGNGRFDVDEGLLEGIDIGKIIRSASALVRGFEGGSFNTSALTAAITEARGPASETQFSNLDSSFTVTNGLVQAQNIALQGPLFLIEGDGTVNLPNQSMDMSFVPTVYELVDQVSEEVSGQTIEQQVGRKLNIPLQITGTFNDPKIGFDTQGIVRGVVEDRLRGLIGGETAAGEEPQSLEDTLRDRAQQELLNRFGGMGADTEENGENADGETPDEEASAEEEVVNTLINGLFGGGKED